MEDKLKSLSGIILDLLKFAEAKNGVLITVCGAGIWSILQILKDKSSFPEFRSILIFIMLVFLASLMISLGSFVAKTLNRTCEKGTINEVSELNLLFFGHICKLTPQEFLEGFYKKYAREKAYDYCTAYEKDLANQIVVNSEIVMKKYRLFNISITLLLVGLLFSIFGFIIIA